MNNSYFQYLETSKLLFKYREAIELLQEELENNGGELTNEIENKFKGIEDDGEQLAWEILQLQDAIDSEIKTNKERIERIEKLNVSLGKQDEYLNSLLSILIKENGKLNNSANFALKLGERNLTLQKKISYDVGDNFSNPDFIRYSVKGKITEGNAKRIETFLHQKGEDGILEKQVLKRELASHIKETGILPDDVEQIVKTFVSKR